MIIIIWWSKDSSDVNARLTPLKESRNGIELCLRSMLISIILTEGGLLICLQSRVKKFLAYPRSNPQLWILVLSRLTLTNGPLQPNFSKSVEFDQGANCNPIFSVSFTLTKGPLQPNLMKLFKTSRPGPGAAREKFDKLMSPIWTFYITQSFLSCDPFGFWSLGYPGVQGSGLRGHACVKNLP